MKVEQFVWKLEQDDLTAVSFYWRKAACWALMEELVQVKVLNCYRYWND